MDHDIAPSEEAYTVLTFQQPITTNQSAQNMPSYPTHYKTSNAMVQFMTTLTLSAHSPRIQESLPTHTHSILVHMDKIFCISRMKDILLHSSGSMHNNYSMASNFSTHNQNNFLAAHMTDLMEEAPLSSNSFQPSLSIAEVNFLFIAKKMPKDIQPTHNNMDIDILSQPGLDVLKNLIASLSFGSSLSSLEGMSVLTSGTNVPESSHAKQTNTTSHTHAWAVIVQNLLL